MRFRENPVAIKADVEAMFHQVRVRPDDVDTLSFLWFPENDLSKDPQEYRMLVHLFGGVWSPSCANYALRRTAEDNRDKFGKEAVETVTNDFYVDDCLKSLKTEEEAVEQVQQLRELLACGGFRLTKWLSNRRKDWTPSPSRKERKESGN